MKTPTLEVDEKRIQVAQDKITLTVADAESIVIIDDATMSKAGEVLSQVNQQLDEITKDKETLTKPLNAVLSNIRKRYKPLELQLDKVKKHLRSEIGAYQTKKEEEAEAEKAAIASRVGSGKGKLKMETAAKKMSEVDIPEKKVETASGSISFRDDYELTIINIREIPDQFLIVDEAAIKKVFKAGGEVAGVSAKKVKIPVNRR